MQERFSRLLIIIIKILKQFEAVIIRVIITIAHPFQEMKNK